MKYYYDSDELTPYTGMRDVVKVGGMFFEEQLIPLYVRTTTGDVLYSHPIDETGMCLGEICIPDPMELAACRDAIRIVSEESKGKFSGVIYTMHGRYVITPDFKTCQLVSYTDYEPLAPAFEIDPNLEDALDSRED